MNIERLTQLAEWLEAGAKHERITFDMSTGIVFNTTEDLNPEEPAACGSSCCIAGAAVQFFGNVKDHVQRTIELYGGDILDNRERREVQWAGISSNAACLLGLTDDQSIRLFTPIAYFGRRLSDYSDPAWAARTIRHLIATGVVDWDATMESAR